MSFWFCAACCSFAASCGSKESSAPGTKAGCSAVGISAAAVGAVSVCAVSACTPSVWAVSACAFPAMAISIAFSVVAASSVCGSASAVSAFPVPSDFAVLSFLRFFGSPSAASAAFSSTAASLSRASVVFVSSDAAFSGCFASAVSVCFACFASAASCFPVSFTSARASFCEFFALSSALPKSFLSAFALCAAVCVFTAERRLALAFFDDGAACAMRFSAFICSPPFSRNGTALRRWDFPVIQCQRASGAASRLRLSPSSMSNGLSDRPQVRRFPFP